MLVCVVVSLVHRVKFPYKFPNSLTSRQNDRDAVAVHQNAERALYLCYTSVRMPRRSPARLILLAPTTLYERLYEPVVSSHSVQDCILSRRPLAPRPSPPRALTSKSFRVATANTHLRPVSVTRANSWPLPSASSSHSSPPVVVGVGVGVDSLLPLSCPCGCGCAWCRRAFRSAAAAAWASKNASKSWSGVSGWMTWYVCVDDAALAEEGVVNG